MELLAVIAIVTLLAALLLPAIRDAAGRARAARCQVNERQIGVGVIGYVQDNEGMMPPRDPTNWVVAGVATAYPKFSDMIAPYLQLKSAFNTVWICPADKRKLNNSYGLNVNSVPSEYGIDRPYPYSGVVRRSQVVLLADAATWGSGSDREIFWFKDALVNVNVEFRHPRSRANESTPPTTGELAQATAQVLFYDGHVEARAFGSLSSTNYYP